MKKLNLAIAFAAIVTLGFVTLNEASAGHIHPGHFCNGNRVWNDIQHHCLVPNGAEHSKMKKTN